MQNSLNKFFDELDALGNLPTASSYCKARNKLNPLIFKEMSNKSVNDFYRLYEGGETWNSRRVLGVDCTKLSLFNTEELNNKYKVNSGNGFETNQWLSSFIYDVFNEITLNASFDKLKAEKDFLLKEHINYLQQTDIITMDKAYADYSVMAFLVAKKVDWVIRCKTSSTFKVFEEFMTSDDTDKIIELNLTYDQKKFVRENNLPEKIKVRLLKVELGNGNVELLATSLFEESKDEIAYLYGCRWGIETYFDRLKNIFELERFSGKKELTLQQDFYAMVFLTNLESIMIKDSEQEIKKETKHRKYEYKVNRNVSYSAMINYVCELFFNPKLSDEQIFYRLNELFKASPIIVRPGRNNERKRLTNTRRLRANLYEKRISS